MPSEILQPVWPVEPVRIGVLIDSEMDTEPTRNLQRAMRMALDEAKESGLLKRPVELIVREVNGLPYGEWINAVRAWDHLVGEGCVTIGGPIYTENGIACHAAIERDKVPSIGMPSGEHWTGPYCFQFQNGAPSEDAALLANWLADNGYRTVAVVHEDNDFGEEYYKGFRQQSRRRGLQAVSDQACGPASPLTLEETLEVSRAAKADAFVYMGFGTDGNRFLHLVRELDFPGPKLVGSNFMGGTEPGRGFGYVPSDFEGWIGIDQFDEDNPVTNAVLDRFEARYGERPRSCFLTQGYDWGNTIAEALAITRSPVPTAMRNALEQVRALPAAGGSRGNYISYGPYDHKAYKGQFTSLSTVRGGVIHKVR
jgi:ABC-type branched-subunit amino acid transport system substrate-binding protein